MVIFGYYGIDKTFKYKVSAFSSKRQAKYKIEESCDLYGLAAAAGNPPPLQISLINTNI